MSYLSPEESINAEIAELPAEAQIRVNTIADMLRSLSMTDEMDETMLAMILVLEEIHNDDEACECVDGTLQ